jgi:protein-tyrosine phosphatase
VALQVNESEGNIALSCNNGRSRSPVYLIAYLVLCYDKPVDEAIEEVRGELDIQRGECLDRYCGYQDALNFIVL